MEFVKENAFRGKGSILAIAAVLAIVLSCLAVSMPADAADDDKTLYIHGTLDASIIGSSLQVIVVDGDLTVEDTQFIVANNTFIVNEGVTLTLKSGSYVKIASGSAEIKGKVVCAEGTSLQPTFVVENGGTANIAGTVTVNGINGFVLNDGASANVAGELTISETGNASMSGVTVKNGGTLNVNSTESTYLKGLNAESGSKIVINGSATYQGMTNQDGSSFVVSSTGTLTQVTGADNAMVNYGTFTNNGTFDGNIDNHKVVVAESDKTSIYNVVMRSGSTFESNNLAGAADFYDADAEQIFVNNVKGVVVSSDGSNVILAGTPVSSGEVPTISIVGTKALFNEDMTFPADVNVVLAYGSALLVSSYVTMIDNTTTAPITGTGTLTVTGTVKTAVPLVIKSASTPGITLNAVYYMKDNYHYYTTFDKALAANPDYIKVYGDIVFDSDTVIPNGMEIDMTEANSVTITSNATVTVEDGGIFRNGDVMIDVNGTLILQNTETSMTNVDKVDSDVLVESGIMTKFTNLKRALEEAQSGDVIYLKRNHVYISEDTVIPEGVTLKIGYGNTVEVIDGAKLTVNGILDANPGSFIITNGSTIVNGSFVFAAPFSTYSSQIAGAYFTNNGVNTIAPLSFVVGKEDNIGSTIEMYGDNSVGDLSFTGSGKTIYVRSGAFDAGTLSLDGFNFDSDGADSINGKFVIGNGSLALVNAKDVVLSKSAEGGVLVNSAIAAASSDASATMSGLVRLNQSIAEGVSPVFAEDADVYLTNSYVFYQDVTIPAGAKVVAESSLQGTNFDVAGTLFASSLTADKVAVESTGAMHTSAGDDAAASYTINNFVVDGNVYAGDYSNLALKALSGAGKITLGDNCAINVDGDVTSLNNIEAGDYLTLKANSISIADATVSNGAKLIADSIASTGTLTAGDSFSVQATEAANLAKVVAGNGASITAKTATVCGEFQDNLNITTEGALNGTTISAGANAVLAADSISLEGFTLGDDSNVMPTNDLTATGTSSVGANSEILAKNIVLGKIDVGEYSNVTANGDLTLNDVANFADNSSITCQNMTVNGDVTVTPAVPITVNGALSVPGTLNAVATDALSSGSLTVKEGVDIAGTMDYRGVDVVDIAGDLNVTGTAAFGAADGAVDVDGNVVVASAATLNVADGASLNIGKDLTVNGTLVAGENSYVTVGEDAKGTANVTGSITTGANSTFKAAALTIPGVFTSSGEVVIGTEDSVGTSTVPGTIDVKDGTFTMYSTVYLYGKILTENGVFKASKMYIGVDESIFSSGANTTPATVPMIGSNVTIMDDGVAYVSPAVSVNGAFAGFDSTKFYKGDDLYLTVFADPDNYVDSYTFKGESFRRNIDSVYASDDDAYVNGWRATKTVKDADEAANARVYDPYGTYEAVWLNAVYNIYNFKLYVADETATPMVGKVVDGNVVPLTLAKTGLNCYESPVNLEAGTYRVALTYALGHEDELINNPLVVNGVPQSTYDFTFDGNSDNNKHVEYLLQFSFEEEDAPVIEEVKSLSLTDILLIVIVILIIVVAIVLILRARRS